MFAEFEIRKNAEFEIQKKAEKGFQLLLDELAAGSQLDDMLGRLIWVQKNKRKRTSSTRGRCRRCVVY